MVYLWATVSSFMMIVGLPAIIMTLKLMPSYHEMYGRYFGNVFSLLAGLCLLFIPLFYGSMGSLYEWLLAPLIYNYAWTPFILVLIAFYIADRRLKADLKKSEPYNEDDT